MSNKFTVIRGGLLDDMSTKKENTGRREFIEAYVTNTRLMGVLAIYLHSRFPENEEAKDIHQFFYIDIEEYGFEDYKSVKNGDLDLVKSIENSLIGGLGGDNIPLTEREAAYLIQKYAKYNRSHGLPLPECRQEYNYLLTAPANLTDEEIDALMKKQCVSLDSEYETVNYFLMRCVGRDFEGASLLSKPGLPLNLFPDFNMGTFCKNMVKRIEPRDTFLSESLVEIDGQYHLMVTEVTVRDLTVVSYEKISSFRISAAEAAMMLARPEYISVYQLPRGSAPFTKDSLEITKRATQTEYDAGVLYMVFHTNNKHVNKQEYRLCEDVLGNFFVLGNGQLVITAYTLSEIRILEYAMRMSKDYPDIEPVERYEFMDPVFFEFVQCGLDDFEKFVNFLRISDDN